MKIVIQFESEEERKAYWEEVKKIYPESMRDRYTNEELEAALQSQLNAQALAAYLRPTLIAQSHAKDEANKALEADTYKKLGLF